jgi:hypothetical protein
MSNNPNVAAKRHAQLQLAFKMRLANVDKEVEAWLDSVESMIVDYYTPMLNVLQQSGNPEDEQLYIDLDKQYTSRMASVQAARERMTEFGAHLALAITPKNWIEQ